MLGMKKLTVVICSSANFYRHVNEVRAVLEAEGVKVVVPHNAGIMAETGDYDVTHYKTWHENGADYTKKADYMRWHFDEITKGDAVLVVNDEKHGQANYIGPNVLMEMSLAWYQQKPIFILNGLPAESTFEEEIKGMMPVVLNGELTALIAAVV